MSVVCPYPNIQRGEGMLPSWPAAFSPTHTPASASQAAAAGGETPDGGLELIVRGRLTILLLREMLDGDDDTPAVGKENTHRGATDVENRNAAPK